MSMESRNVASASPNEPTPGGSGGSTAIEESSRSAPSMSESARELASEAAGQAGDVMAQARQQAASLMEQTRQEARVQLDAKSSEAAAGMRTLSSQLRALGEGRTEEAGPLGNHVHNAQQFVEGLAERLERDGSEGVLRDASAFARRRPGAFLLGAAIAGFAAGRLVRAGAASSEQTQRPAGTRAMFEPPRSEPAVMADASSGQSRSDVIPR